MQLILQFKQTASNSKSETILFFGVEAGLEEISHLFWEGWKNLNAPFFFKSLILKSGKDLRDLLIISTGVELTLEQFFSRPSEHRDTAIIIIKAYQQID